MKLFGENIGHAISVFRAKHSPLDLGDETGGEKRLRLAKEYTNGSSAYLESPLVKGMNRAHG